MCVLLCQIIVVRLGLRGDALYSAMAQAKLTNHSAKSMKNRFLRYLETEFTVKLDQALAKQAAMASSPKPVSKVPWLGAAAAAKYAASAKASAVKVLYFVELQFF